VVGVEEQGGAAGRVQPVAVDVRVGVVEVEDLGVLEAGGGHGAADRLGAVAQVLAPSAS
jgi:hypothetical protein